jgi:hypothetical protein
VNFQMEFAVTSAHVGRKREITGRSIGVGDLFPPFPVSGN